MDFVQFLAENLETMNVICEQANLFESLIYDRSKAVFEYFGLPYEAEGRRGEAIVWKVTTSWPAPSEHPWSIGQNGTATP